MSRTGRHLGRVRHPDESDAFVLAAKRIENILRGAEPAESAEPRKTLFEEPAERELHAAFHELASDVEQAAAARRYEDALRRIAELAEVLDRFFEEVLVNADDECANLLTAELA